MGMRGRQYAPVKGRAQGCRYLARVVTTLLLAVGLCKTAPSVAEASAPACASPIVVTDTAGLQASATGGGSSVDLDVSAWYEPGQDLEPVAFTVSLASADYWEAIGDDSAELTIALNASGASDTIASSWEAQGCWGFAGGSTATAMASREADGLPSLQTAVGSRDAESAVNGCAAAALSLGHSFFALLDKACYTEPAGAITYQADGSSGDCAADGTGASGAMSVYRVDVTRAHDLVTLVPSVVTFMQGDSSQTRTVWVYPSAGAHSALSEAQATVTLKATAVGADGWSCAGPDANVHVVAASSGLTGVAVLIDTPSIDEGDSNVPLGVSLLAAAPLNGFGQLAATLTPDGAGIDAGAAPPLDFAVHADWQDADNTELLIRHNNGARRWWEAAAAAAGAVSMSSAADAVLYPAQHILKSTVHSSAAGLAALGSELSVAIAVVQDEDGRVLVSSPIGVDDVVSDTATVSDESGARCTISLAAMPSAAVIVDVNLTTTDAAFAGWFVAIPSRLVIQPGEWSVGAEVHIVLNGTSGAVAPSAHATLRFSAVSVGGLVYAENRTLFVSYVDSDFVSLAVAFDGLALEEGSVPVAMTTWLGTDVGGWPTWTIDAASASEQHMDQVAGSVPRLSTWGACVNATCDQAPMTAWVLDDDVHNGFNPTEDHDVLLVLNATVSGTGDPMYDWQSRFLPVPWADDDAVGIWASVRAGTVLEEGNATGVPVEYGIASNPVTVGADVADVRLAMNGTALPDSGPYVVSLTVSPESEVVSVGSDPAGFWTPSRTAWVAVVDDDVVLGTAAESSLRISATALDSAGNETDTTPYHSFAAQEIDLELQIADNDVPSVLVSVANISMEEGSFVTYTVALGSRPTAVVAVTPTALLNSGIVVAPRTLWFEPATYSAPQTVTVAAYPHVTATGLSSEVITHVSNSTDAVYDAAGVLEVQWPGAMVNVTVEDTDFAGSIVAIDSTLVEGVDSGVWIASAGVPAALGSSPASGSVAVSVVGQGNATGTEHGVWFGASLMSRRVFVAADASEFTTVLATPRNDDAFTTFSGNATVEVNTTLQVEGAGLGSGFVSTTRIQVTVRDDEDPLAGFPALASLREGDYDAARFGITLRAPPPGDVVVEFTARDASALPAASSIPGRVATGGFDVLPAMSTFAADQWDVPMYVSTAVHDDEYFTGNDTVLVSYTVRAVGAGYGGRDLLFPTRHVHLSVQDDELVGVAALHPLLLTEGANETLGLLVSSRPAGGGAITMTVNAVPVHEGLEPLDLSAPADPVFEDQAAAAEAAAYNATAPTRTVFADHAFWWRVDMWEARVPADHLYHAFNAYLLNVSLDTLTGNQTRDAGLAESVTCPLQAYWDANTLACETSEAGASSPGEFHTNDAYLNMSLSAVLTVADDDIDIVVEGTVDLGLQGFGAPGASGAPTASGVRGIVVDEGDETRLGVRLSVAPFADVTVSLTPENNGYRGGSLRVVPSELVFTSTDFSTIWVSVASEDDHTAAAPMPGTGMPVAYLILRSSSADAVAGSMFANVSVGIVDDDFVGLSVVVDGPAATACGPRTSADVIACGPAQDANATDVFVAVDEGDAVNVSLWLASEPDVAAPVSVGLFGNVSEYDDGGVPTTPAPFAADDVGDLAALAGPGADWQQHSLAGVIVPDDDVWWGAAYRRTLTVQIGTAANASAGGVASFQALAGWTAASLQVHDEDYPGAHFSVETGGARVELEDVSRTPPVAEATAQLAVYEVTSGAIASAVADFTVGVRLGSEPKAPLAIEVDISPAHMFVRHNPAVIAAHNWNSSAVVIQVQALDDEVRRDEVVSVDIRLSGADVDYAGSVLSLDVSIIDDDLYGLAVASPGSQTVLEEGTVTDVDVLLATGALGGLALEAAFVPNVELAQFSAIPLQPNAQQFDSAAPESSSAVAGVAWWTPLAMQATVNEDEVDIPDGNLQTLVLSVNSTDPAAVDLDGPLAFNATASGVAVFEVTDNDDSGTLVEPASLLLAEVAGQGPITGAAEWATVNVSLRSRPFAEVIVAIVPTSDPPGSTADVSIWPRSLRFNASVDTWRTGFLVNITAVNDFRAEGGIENVSVAFVFSSEDPLYDGSVRTVDVVVVDDDIASFALTPLWGDGSSRSVVLDERAWEGGNNSASFAVEIGSEPQSDPVSVRFNLSAVSGATHESLLHTVEISPSLVVFPVGLAPAAVTVQLRVIDDDVRQQPTVFNLTAVVETQEAAYAALAATDMATGASSLAEATRVTLQIADDDVTGAAAATLSHVVDGEAGSPVRVLLASAVPVRTAANVSLHGSASTQVSVPHGDTGVGILPDLLDVAQRSEANVVPGPLGFSVRGAGWLEGLLTFAAPRDYQAWGGLNLQSIVVAVVATDWVAVHDVVLPDLRVIVDDIDSASVVVVDDTSDIVEGPGGGFAAPTFRLACKPFGNVTLLFDAEAPQTAPYDVLVQAVPGGSDPSSGHSRAVVIGRESWNQSTAWRVEAVDDAVDEPTFPQVVLSGAVVSGDVAYAALSNVTTTVRVVDNDDAGLSLLVGNDTAVLHAFENGSAAIYSVVLDTAILSDVTVNISVDALPPFDAVLLSEPTPDTLTFTSANWHVPQQVAIVVPDDDIDWGDSYTQRVRHSAQMLTNGTLQWLHSGMDIEVHDNDTAVVVSSLHFLNVTEGDTGTFSVHLATQPQQTVHLVLTVLADANHRGAVSTLVLDPPAVTFSPSNWSTPTPISVLAVNDDVDEPVTTHVVSVAVSSGDPEYAPLATVGMSIAFVDDDVLGFQTTHVIIAEGGSTAYWVNLTSEPKDDVTVTVSAADITREAATLANLPLQVSAQPNIDSLGTYSDTVTFTASDWFVAQEVVVLLDDDQIDWLDKYEAAITLTASSVADPRYNGHSSTRFDITALDNDEAAIGRANITVDEGSSAQYSVWLETEPTDDVVVSVVVLDVAGAASARANLPLVSSAQPGLGSVGVDTAQLTFTPSDWFMPQNLTVVMDDDEVDWLGRYEVQVNHSASSSDRAYEGVDAADWTMVVTDNDDVSLIWNSTVVAEGQSAPYWVRLGTEPTAAVVVTVAIDNITGAASVRANQPFVMSAQPSLNASGTYSFDLTFTPANWNVFQSVDAIVDEDVVDWLVQYDVNVSHTAASSDRVYDGLSASDWSITAVDNDAAGFVWTNVSVPEGGSVQYGVRLATEPTYDVVVTVDVDDVRGAAAARANLPLYNSTRPSLGSVGVFSHAFSFTPLNWATMQYVTLSALEDVVDWAKGFDVLVNHSATSADPAYDLVHASDWSVFVEDNDEVSLIWNSTVVAEGRSAPYWVRLGTEPTAAVVVTVAIDNITGAATARAGLPFVMSAQPSLNASGVYSFDLTFTPANWNVFQSVDAIVDEDVVDWLVQYDVNVSHTAASSDRVYDGLSASDWSIAAVDNDVANFVWSGTTVQENASAPYALRLATEPTTNVTVNVALGWMRGAATVPAYVPSTSRVGPRTGTTLLEPFTVSAWPALGSTSARTVNFTFTPLNWNVDQVVDVIMGDDDVAWMEWNTSTYDVEVFHTSVVGDFAYNRVQQVDYSITVVDGDDAGAFVVPVRATVPHVEGEAPVDLGVRLMSRPLGPVNATVQVMNISTARARVANATGLGGMPVWTHGPGSTSGLSMWEESRLRISTAYSDGSVTDGDGALRLTVVLHFTPDNWATPRVFSVAATDDDIAWGQYQQLLHVQGHSHVDTAYDAVTSVHAVDVEDSDVPAVVATPRSITITEGAQVGTYGVSLNTKPVQDVTVALLAARGPAVNDAPATALALLDASAASAATTVTATAAPAEDYLSLLVFTSTDWNVPQQVAVQGLDNDVQEVLPARRALVWHNCNSSDYVYNSNRTVPVTYVAAFKNLTTGLPDSMLASLVSAPLPATNVTVSIVDNDVAAIEIAPVSVSVDENPNAAAGEYGIVLATEPVAPVTVEVSFDAAQVAVDPSILEFLPENWDTEQVVAVRGVSDEVPEASIHITSLDHSSASVDPHYNDLDLESVSVDIADWSTAPDVVVDETPAPVLSEVRILEDAESVRITLDRASDMGGMLLGIANKKLCLNTGLFRTSSLKLFRNKSRDALDPRHDGGPWCWWETTSKLRVDLEPNYGIVGGSVVGLRGGNIRAAGAPASVKFSIGALPAIGRKPLPLLLWAQFGNSATSISVKFSQDSSGKVAGAQTGPCSAVFVEAATLGASSTCSWSDLRTLKVSLGAGATILPHADAKTTGAPAATSPLSCPVSKSAGTKLTIIKGSVRAVQGSLLQTTGCVRVVAPTAPVLPIPSLIGQVNLGLCDALDVSATGTKGGGGRPMTFAWKVEALNSHANASLANVTAAIKKQEAAALASLSSGHVGATKLLLPRELFLSSARFKLSVFVRNFIAPQFKSTSVVVSKRDLPIPSVYIQGLPVRDITRTRDHIIKASAASPVCEGEDAAAALDAGRAMGFVWSVVSTAPTVTTTDGAMGLSGNYSLVRFNLQDPRLLAAQGGDPKVLRIPSSMMRVGHVVTLRITAFMLANRNINNTASVTFEVKPAPVSVSIARGNRKVGYQQPTVINASAPAHAKDIDAITMQPFRFSWTCTDVTALAAGTSGVCRHVFFGTPLVLTDYIVSGTGGGVLRIPPETLKFGPEATPHELRFSVTVSKGRSGWKVPEHLRTASGSVILSVVNSNPPEVSVQRETSSQRPKINPEESLRLLALVESVDPGSLKYAWSVSGPGAATSMFSSPLDRVRVVTAANTLVGGGTYQFRVVATDSNGKGFAEFEVEVNTPPTSGYVAVTPTTGYAATTEFSISAPSWEDDLADLPLKFQFGYTMANPVAALVNDAGSNVDASLLIDDVQADASSNGAAAVSVDDTFTFVLGGFSERDVKNALLPVGEGENSTVTMTVFVQDNLGATAKSSAGPTGEALTAEVLPLILSEEDKVALMANASSSRLSNSLAEGNVEQFVADLTVFLTVLDEPPASPCDGINCGAHGQCVDGTCFCDEASGYTGTFCEVAPAPVHGGWGQWAAWSSCSFSCGGGTRSRSRICDAPAPTFGGSSCSAQSHTIGNATEVGACNTQACPVVAVNGGYSEWSQWTSCSATCPTGIYGIFKGSRSRLRTCDNPVPTKGALSCVDGGLGEPVETAECNFECFAPLRTCDGEVTVVEAGATAPTTKYCSGHGTCQHSKPECRTDEPCTADCVCDTGFVSKDCGLTQEQLDARIALRDNLFTTFSNALNQTDGSLEAVGQQSNALRGLASNTDELSEETKVLVFDVIGGLLQQASVATDEDGNTAPLSVNTASALLLTLSALFEDVDQVTSATLRRRRLGVGASRRALADEVQQRRDRLVAISGSVDGISDGLVRGALPGEDARHVTTGTISVSARSELSTEVSGFTTASGARFTFPRQTVGAGVVGATGANQFDAPPVTMQAVQWAQNPRSYAMEDAGNGTEVTQLAAATISMDIKLDTGAEAEVTHLPEPIIFCLPAPLNTNYDEFRCSYFDTLSETWVADGMVLMGFVVDKGQLRACCATLHLTDLSAEEEPLVPSLNTIDPIGDLGLLNRYLDPESIVSLMVLGILMGAMLMSYAFSMTLDWRGRYQFHISREMHFLRHGRFVKEAPLGQHNGAKVDDKVIVPPQDVMDPKKQAELEKALEEITKMIAKKKRQHERLARASIVERLVLSTWWDFTDRFRRGHAWANVFISPIDEQFQISRPQRVMIFTAMCMAAMAATAFLYGKDPKRLDSQILVGMFASMFMVPAEKGFPMLFKRVNTLRSVTVAAQLKRARQQRIRRLLGLQKRHLKKKTEVMQAKAQEKRKVKAGRRGAASPATSRPGSATPTAGGDSTPPHIRDIDRQHTMGTRNQAAFSFRAAGVRKNRTRVAPAPAGTAAVVSVEAVPHAGSRSGVAEAKAAWSDSAGAGNPGALTPLAGQRTSMEDVDMSASMIVRKGRLERAPLGGAGGGSGSAESVPPGLVGSDDEGSDDADIDLVALGGKTGASKAGLVVGGDSDTSGDDLDLFDVAEADGDSTESEDVDSGNPASNAASSKASDTNSEAGNPPAGAPSLAAAAGALAQSSRDVGAGTAPAARGPAADAGVDMAALESEGVREGDAKAAAPEGEAVSAGKGKGRFKQTRTKSGRFRNMQDVDRFVNDRAYQMANETRRIAMAVMNRSRTEVWLSVAALFSVWGALVHLLAAIANVFYTPEPTISAAIFGAVGVVMLGAGIMGHNYSLNHDFKNTARCVGVTFCCEVITAVIVPYFDFDFGVITLYGLLGMQFMPLFAVLFVVFCCFNRLKRSYEREQRALADAEPEQTRETVQEAASAVQRVFRGQRGRVRSERRDELNKWLALKTERQLLVFLAYLVVLTFIGVLFYINLIFGVKFTPAVARGWMFSSLIAFVTDLVVQQPFGMLLRSSFMAVLYERRQGKSKMAMLGGMGAEGGGSTILGVLV